MLRHVVSCCLCTIISLLKAIAASSDIKVIFDLNTVTPGAARRAVNGDARTWILSPGQAAANFSAATIRPYTVSSTDYCLLFVNDELQCN